MAEGAARGRPSPRPRPGPSRGRPVAGVHAEAAGEVAGQRLARGVLERKRRADGDRAKAGQVEACQEARRRVDAEASRRSRPRRSAACQASSSTMTPRRAGRARAARSSRRALLPTPRFAERPGAEDDPVGAGRAAVTPSPPPSSCRGRGGVVGAASARARRRSRRAPSGRFMRWTIWGGAIWACSGSRHERYWPRPPATSMRMRHRGHQARRCPTGAARTCADGTMTRSVVRRIVEAPTRPRRGSGLPAPCQLLAAPQLSRKGARILSAFGLGRCGRYPPDARLDGAPRVCSGRRRGRHFMDRTSLAGHGG